MIELRVMYVLCQHTWGYFTTASSNAAPNSKVWKNDKVLIEFDDALSHSVFTLFPSDFGVRKLLLLKQPHVYLIMMYAS